MGKLIIKNIENTEFTLEHIDGYQANRVTSKQIAETPLVVDTIKDLTQLTLDDIAGSTKKVQVLGFHEINDGGGGLFVFNPNTPKNQHNGGTIIALGKEFPEDWNTDNSSWFSETDDSLGCFERVLEGDYVTPEMFGAKGDDTTDDVNSIEAMFKYFSNVVFSKKYFCSKSINISTIDKLQISGNGSIRFSSDGLTILVNDYNHYINIKDITLFSDNYDFSNVKNTAITINYSPQIDYSIVDTGLTAPRVIKRGNITNVKIYGSKLNTTAFYNGIKLIGAMHYNIVGCDFNGAYKDTQNNIVTGDSILLEGYPGNGCEIVISECYSTYYNNSVHSKDMEGIYVDKCNFVAVNTGVLIDNSDIQPQANITNSHINAYKKNVYLINSAQSNISGCVLYNRAVGSSSPFESISILNSFQITISNNNIVNTSDIEHYSINANNSYDLMINNNLFQNSTHILNYNNTENVSKYINNNIVGIPSTVISGDSIKYISSKYSYIVSNIPEQTILTSSGEYELIHIDDVNSNIEIFNNIFTCNITGKYLIEIVLVLPSLDNNRILLKSFKNDDIVVSSLSWSGLTNLNFNKTITLSGIIELNRGDTISFKIKNLDGNDLDIPASESQVSIKYIDI